MSKDITGIILMAGTGSRFNHSTPKQFHRLSGKPLYQYTVDAFKHSGLFDEVILVCHPSYVNKVRSEISDVTVISGGNTRQESSYLALKACPDAEIVVIHDGARPFVTTQILFENVMAAKRYGAANTCIPCSDTIVHCTDGASITHIPNRREYLRGQTPQSFQRSLILQAHESATTSDATDDCQLVHRLGHPVHIVAGSEENIKVTSQLDLFLAEQILVRCSPPLSSKQLPLNGKVFAVTGGTGGIGKAICRALEAEGATAVPLARSSTDFSVDLRSFDASKIIFEKLSKVYGSLDGLINGIGSLQIKDVRELSEHEINGLIASNLTSLIYACRLAKLKDNASILNIASTSCYRGRKGYAVYSAAKAAVVNLTQGLAEEHPDMRINALIPGRVETPMRSQNFPNESAETLLQPEAVAKQVISILKDAQLTGSLIEVRP